MIVGPVYPFSALLDTYIFNSIQFWSGDNPIKATALGTDGATRIVRLNWMTITAMKTEFGETVSYERKGIVERRTTIVPSATGYRLVTRPGPHLRKPSMMLMAPSLCSIEIARSCSGGLGINFDRLCRAMAQFWTSLRHFHAVCRNIHVVRRWSISRTPQEESTGRKIVVALS